MAERYKSKAPGTVPAPHIGVLGIPQFFPNCFTHQALEWDFRTCPGGLDSLMSPTSEATVELISSGQVAQV